MKILFFTDTHIRGTTPANRKDNLVDTLEEKFNEVLDISNKHNVDYILHGGDLFDRPDVSISIVSRFVTILNKFKMPIYIICGNHDIYGHNPDTINRTMLGLFNSIGTVNLIDENQIVFLKKDDVTVQLTGQPYIYNIDDNNSLNRYIINDVDPKADYSIHMVHGMLLDKPFIKGIPYTLIYDIKSTKADITLSGHYHSGFGIIKSNDKYFVNPGSLIRITNSLKEIERIPQVVLIDLNDDINIKLIPLKTALPGEKILDRKKIETFIFKNERLVQFKQSIDSTVSFEKLDINEVLLEVSTAEGVAENVKEEALRRIASSQMKDLGDD
ncbi:metallophosphoesterase family protein [Anaerosalibacter massiliensis]|uniref:Metallophosphoesterase n=1 Tax=Anaerosalibacter massiliensis TaxID=1347392 RepID=A0A9X2MK39_9FIRM|nr:metallophosphoesterase [Anaerosalibacter massiliensis]MCR2042711.1 metallophosphoesterase [Anaerosalibacter massiliensis]